MEARFHEPTSGAPANWRVKRRFPGTPDGRVKPLEEHLTRSVDGKSYEWVSNKKWYNAQNAYNAGNATPEQKDLLRRGHF